MNRIVFASRNSGKIKEVKALLEDIDIALLSLDDYQDIPEIVEDGRTFLDNALKKARFVCEWTGEVALADDSGLAVDALGGAPGVHSARYAGPRASDGDNIRKLLQELRDTDPKKRTATFCCVLVLCRPDGHVERFEGRWRGRISPEPAGSGGFGYDPVFFLPELSMTAAQLPAAVKNRLSHRAEAFREFKEYLQKTIIREGAASVNGA